MRRKTVGSESEIADMRSEYKSLQKPGKCERAEIQWCNGWHYIDGHWLNVHDAWWCRNKTPTPKEEYDKLNQKFTN